MDQVCVKRVSPCKSVKNIADVLAHPQIIRAMMLKCWKGKEGSKCGRATGRIEKVEIDVVFRYHGSYEVSSSTHVSAYSHNTLCS